AAALQPGGSPVCADRARDARQWRLGAAAPERRPLLREATTPLLERDRLLSAVRPERDGGAPAERGSVSRHGRGHVRPRPGTARRFGGAAGGARLRDLGRPLPVRAIPLHGHPLRSLARGLAARPGARREGSRSARSWLVLGSPPA